MTDYISREAAYETLTGYYHHSTQMMHDALHEALDRVPAADVRPVVMGEWVVLDDCSNEGIYCSKCHTKIFDFTHKPKKKLSNYCPNCGAKMEG